MLPFSKRQGRPPESYDKIKAVVIAPADGKTKSAISLINGSDNTLNDVVVRAAVMSWAEQVNGSRRLVRTETTFDLGTVKPGQVAMSHYVESDHEHRPTSSEKLKTLIFPKLDPNTRSEVDHLAIVGLSATLPDGRALDIQLRSNGHRPVVRVGDQVAVTDAPSL